MINFQKTAKILGIVILTSCWSPASSFAQKASGGGFAHFQARQWIAYASNKLLPRVEASASEYFNLYPGSREMVIKALKNIELLEKTQRQRDGQDLILDYDLASGHIQVLKNFFDVFTLATDPKIAVPAIKSLILHETAHLFGITDDLTAEAFAQDVLKTGFLPIYSGQTSDFCDSLLKITTSYDPPKVTQCFQAVHEKFCANKPVYASQEFFDTIEKCHSDLRDISTEVAIKRGGDAAYNLVDILSMQYPKPELSK